MTAIVLAAAGLTRLGLADRIRQYLPLDEMLPHRGRACWVSRSGPIVTMCARPWPS